MILNKLNIKEYIEWSMKRFIYIEDCEIIAKEIYYQCGILDALGYLDALHGDRLDVAAKCIFNIWSHNNYMGIQDIDASKIYQYKKFLLDSDVMNCLPDRYYEPFYSLSISHLQRYSQRSREHFNQIRPYIPSMHPYFPGCGINWDKFFKSEEHQSVWPFILTEIDNNPSSMDAITFSHIKSYRFSDSDFHCQLFSKIFKYRKDLREFYYNMMLNQEYISSDCLYSLYIDDSIIIDIIHKINDVDNDIGNFSFSWKMLYTLLDTIGLKIEQLKKELWSFPKFSPDSDDFEYSIKVIQKLKELNADIYRWSDLFDHNGCLYVDARIISFMLQLDNIEQYNCLAEQALPASFVEQIKTRKKTFDQRFNELLISQNVPAEYTHLSMMDLAVRAPLSATDIECISKLLSEKRLKNTSLMTFNTQSFMTLESVFHKHNNDISELTLI